MDEVSEMYDLMHAGGQIYQEAYQYYAGAAEKQLVTYAGTQVGTKHT
jgi:hypothetical protein